MRAARGAGSPFEPLRLLEIDLSEPELQCTVLSAYPPARYRRARVLVRHSGRPLGAVDVDLDPGGTVPPALPERLRDMFGPAIERMRAPRTGPERAVPVSVVIASRERAASLATTLDTVFALDYPAFEVIVVDNAPATDATRALVEERMRDKPNLRYVVEPVPGLAVAHNRGLEVVEGEIAAFTDDDVHVDRRWLRELVTAFEFADDVGCVTGLILPAELETPAQVWLEDRIGINKGYEPRLFDLGRHRPDDPLFPYTAGSFGSGANMAFRTATLRALGGFDPATGTGTRARGGDDLAAFHAVVAAGHTLVYQPAAMVRHAYRRDAESLQRLMFDYGAGLGAFLTKVVIDRPGLLVDVVRRVPQGVVHLRRRSGHAAPVNGHAPAPALGARERLGMLAGPGGYLIERRRRRALYAAPQPERHA
jgi:GT2 family glycosyltransferase